LFKVPRQQFFHAIHGVLGNRCQHGAQAPFPVDAGFAEPIAIYYP